MEYADGDSVESFLWSRDIALFRVVTRACHLPASRQPSQNALHSEVFLT